MLPFFSLIIDEPYVIAARVQRPSSSSEFEGTSDSESVPVRCAVQFSSSRGQEFPIPCQPSMQLEGPGRRLLVHTSIERMSEWTIGSVAK
jgi:hypothetical protein